ncbi:MAG: RAD55 family ATPase [Telluria sp.]
MTDKVSLRTLKTGVPGLDILLGGGLVEFSFNLIAGAPGSGKTTLAHQIMFSLAAHDCRALFFTVLGEPPLKMLRYQQQYGFFDLDKVGTCIRYVNLAEDLRAGDFSGVLDRIMKEVGAFSPALVFVDSFRSVVQTAKGGAEGVADVQAFIQELGTRMTSWQATTFLIGEYAQSEAEANPIMTVADGMIALSHMQEQNAVVRKIRIVKMRGQAHMGGAHPFRITADGLRIYPRVLPQLAADRQPGGPINRDARRVSLGVPGIDELLEGGLPQGHTLLVTGPTGTGKTILGTRFMQEGARNGEKSVLLCFEKGTSRLRNVELAEMAQAGQVRVLESRMIDLPVGQLIDDLLTAIEETGATRVVIDSLSEFSLYLAPEARAEFRLAVFRILTSLAKRGVTVLVTVGLEDRFTELRFSIDDISFLTDAVIAFRYAEVEGCLCKVMSVVKVRGSGHSSDLRQYRITDVGFDIDGPTGRYNGLLSGNAHNSSTNS